MTDGDGEPGLAGGWLISEGDAPGSEVLWRGERMIAVVAYAPGAYDALPIWMATAAPDMWRRLVEIDAALQQPDPDIVRARKLARAFLGRFNR